MNSGGVPNFLHTEKWNLQHLYSESLKEDRSQVNAKILESLNLLQVICGDMSKQLESNLIDLFTSHEGLLLCYEEALTKNTENSDYYNLGAHFLWIGDRTRNLNEAHVEYFRG